MECSNYRMIAFTESHEQGLNEVVTGDNKGTAEHKHNRRPSWVLKRNKCNTTNSNTTYKTHSRKCKPQKETISLFH